MDSQGFKAGRALAALIVVATFAPPAATAVASSPDAWAAFAEDVKARCLREARKNPEIGNPTIAVDPYGSETYGAAIITSRKPGRPPARFVCIYEKRTKKVELVGGFEG